MYSLIMKISPKAKGKVFSGIAYLMMGALAVTTLFPYYWMVTTSLMHEYEIYSFPPKLLPARPQWSNYKEAMSVMPWGRFFFNTAVMAVSVVVGQLFIVSSGAYALSRLKFPGRDKIFMFFLLFMMLPYVVTLIPGFLILKTLGWVNTHLALIIPNLGNIWGMFLMRQYMMTLPPSLEDAARIDGASEFMIYWKIILPLCKPALAAVAIFTFIGMWKAFLWPLIVTRSLHMRTVEVGIAMFSSQYHANFPLQMAAATVVSIPIILVFLFAQRYFIKGINLTAGQF